MDNQRNSLAPVLEAALLDEVDIIDGARHLSCCCRCCFELICPCCGA